MNAQAILFGLVLTVTSSAHAQSILDTIRGRVNDNLNQDSQSSTINYDHTTERGGECESAALRIAEDRAKAACQEKYKKTCEVVDRAGIVRAEEEVRVTMQPIQKIAGYETNDKDECEGKALQKARETAQAACVMTFGVDAACETDSGRILTPVRKAFRVPGVSGQKKYECGAAAIASPRQNGSGSMFSCTATATAKVKKSGLRDIIRL